MQSVHRPERWSADSGRHDVVRLDIPADARRERSFEIYCRLVVSNKTGRADATHAMRVLIDGALEWSRSIVTHADGEDTLDVRLHRTLPTGRSLRLAATCELHRAQRLSLSISADEE